MPRIYKNVLFEKSTTNEEYIVRSPGVGVYYKSPEPGVFLKTGSLAGLLKRLNSIYHLRIPENVSGFVSSIATKDIANPVEYKQQLFTLMPGQTDALTSIKAEVSSDVTYTSAEKIPEGILPIISPTDGIFYRRANPESPPYVTEGDIVSTGHVLGLVEVMKSFNQIKFAGPDFPDKAKVVKILVEDSAEIKSTQVIIWLEPM